MLLGLLPAVVAASTVSGSARPGVALGSGFVHRLAVLFAVLAIAYAILMVFWLAYHGRRASMPVPGVGADIQPADEIDQAADNLDEFQSSTQQRLRNHDEGLEQLRDRVTALEEEPGGGLTPGSTEPSTG